MAGMDGGTGNHDCLCGVGAGHYPFMKFSFFEGYFARIIGAVISWIAGLALAGLLYYVIHSPQGKRPPNSPCVIQAGTH